MTQMKLTTKRDGKAATKMAKSFKHKINRNRTATPIKDGSFKGSIRKNPRRTEYFS